MTTPQRRDDHGVRFRFAWFSLAIMGLSIGFAPVARAVEYGGFGGRPAYPRAENPRTESIFVHTLEPGTVQEEGIKLLNNSSGVKTLIVYAADSVRSTDGAFACKQRVEPKESVGAWIELDQEEVTLGPGSNLVVPFTITVPKNASAGEHNGCILLQEKKADEEGADGGVKLSFRTGLRVAITIPGDLVRNLEITDFQAVPQAGGSLLFHAAVRNTGNVSVDADARVITRSLFGMSIAESGGRYPILRGDLSEWNFELAKPFWGGWYRSQLAVSYDANPEAGVGVESGKALTRLTSPDAWFFAMPSWPALALYVAILAALIAGAYAVLRVRAQARWIASSWVSTQVQPGDSVTALAERHHVAWKILAKANGLRAPYTLTPGASVRVPPTQR